MAEPEITFIFSGQYKCEECGGDFKPTESKSFDDPGMPVIFECADNIHEPRVFHFGCLGEEVMELIRQGKKHEDSRWN